MAGRYSPSLVIEVAANGAGTHSLHPTLSAGGGDGGLHHLHPGIHGHLVVVKGRVGVELGVLESNGDTCRQGRQGDPSGLLNPGGALDIGDIICLSVCMYHFQISTLLG